MLHMPNLKNASVCNILLKMLHRYVNKKNTDSVNICNTVSLRVFAKCCFVLCGHMHDRHILLPFASCRPKAKVHRGQMCTQMVNIYFY